MKQENLSRKNYFVIKFIAYFVITFATYFNLCIAFKFSRALKIRGNSDSLEL